MAWTIIETIDQKGRYFVYNGRATTNGVAADGTLIDASADLTHMTTNSTINPLNGELFSKFKIMTISVTSAAGLLSTTAAISLSWDATADVPFFVLPKYGTATFDFRKLSTYGLINNAGAGITGDVILDVGASVTNGDSWNFMIEGYLVP